MKPTIEKLRSLYDKAQQYNSNIGLYEDFKRNENMFNGKQWEGLNAPDLEKPVLNVIHHVVRYFISLIVSDDIGINISPFDSDDQNDLNASVLEKEIGRVMEDAKVTEKNREAVRNMAVTGDGCFHVYWDADAKTGQEAVGKIRVENLPTTKVLFGNQYELNIQAQDIIFLAARKPLKDIKRETKENGMDADGIHADGEGFRYGEESDAGLATVVFAYSKINGTVWVCKFSGNVWVKEWTDTGLELFPVAFANWERVHNSYHGNSAVTPVIPNQIFINKMLALGMMHIVHSAFPKIIYNRALLPDGWSNSVGTAIGVPGDPSTAVATAFKAPEMSPQVLAMVDYMIDNTRELMGASDAALGNVRPENTSAIIALQRASSAPLELQRLAFFQFVEDYIRIILDMIRAFYGVRKVSVPTPIEPDPMTGLPRESRYTSLPFDFGSINYSALQLKIDVGSSAQWSEFTAVQTLDNLFEKGIIDDLSYLEGLPDKVLPNKNQLIGKLKARQLEQPQGQDIDVAQQYLDPNTQSAYLENLLAGGVPDVSIM